MYELAGGDDLTDESELPETRPNRTTTAPGLGPPTQQVIVFGPATISGENCEFPYSYEGSVYDECILVDEVQKCKTKNNEMV